MDKVQLEREKHFGAAMAIASRLLQSELITENEHRRIKAALIQKYPPEDQLTAGRFGQSHPQNHQRPQGRKGGLTQQHIGKPIRRPRCAYP